MREPIDGLHKLAHALSVSARRSTFCGKTYAQQKLQLNKPDSICIIKPLVRLFDTHQDIDFFFTQIAVDRYLNELRA